MSGTSVVLGSARSTSASSHTSAPGAITSSTTAHGRIAHARDSASSRSNTLATR